MDAVKMLSSDAAGAAPEGLSDRFPDGAPAAPATPEDAGHAGTDGPAAGPRLDLPPAPVTPSKLKREPPAANPRLKKKVPWKGKNILVLLPRDEERGQPGKAPRPLTRDEVAGMLSDWEELGYNTSGFDLDGPAGFSALPRDSYSLSRDMWPSPEDMTHERASRKYQVTLPDLNAWKRYVDELNEAKLRALGVSFGDDEPPAPSISPANTAMSRQASGQYPALPFSPPVPTSSASSVHPQQFPFPTQSPAIASVASPLSFAKFNPRQSISIPPAESPFPFPLAPQQQPSPSGIPPHLLQQGLHRHGSPSLANLSSLMSPSSPFSPDMYAPGMNLHQRHQSLQYAAMPFQHSARASPRLQELREVEEEPLDKSPSRTPEPPRFVHHNHSASLQKEIDEAESHLEQHEYHLEEQFRSQLEHDEDYSPPNETERGAAAPEVAAAHSRGPSVQFAQQAAPFESSHAEGVVLHHPQPHSRGHSLSQKFYVDQDEHRSSADEGNLNRAAPAPEGGSAKDEIETNPSNLGTPVLTSGGFDKLVHERNFSSASHPWSDVGSASASASAAGRRASHSSKPSLSKFNAAAPEFKFNPAGASSFKPSQFVFSSNTFQPFQPSAFQAAVPAPNPPLSASSSHFSLQSATGARITAAAPSFSPAQSDFSFSATGPKFRPDAPAFQPSHALSDSANTPNMSGAESPATLGGSIFGAIDIGAPDIVKPAKKSKAIPIIRPTSQPRAEGAEGDDDGRKAHDLRAKRSRGSGAHDDAVPLFAEPTPEPSRAPAPQTTAGPGGDAPAGGKPAEDDVPLLDTAVSSTIVSETTDSKDATSLSEISPNQSAMNWTPYEFQSEADMLEFNLARPVGEDVFKPHHEKSLSATAKPFTPGGLAGAQPADEDVRETIEQPTADPATEAVEDTEPVERSSPSPTPQPTAPGPAASTRAASPPPPASRGLAASRFAAATPSPPPKSASRPAVSPPASERGELAEERGDEDLVSPLEAEAQGRVSGAPPQPTGSSEEGGPVALEELRDVTFEEIDAVMQHINEQDPTMGVNKTVGPREATFEEIDAVMQHMNEQDPTTGVNKTAEPPRWRQTGAARPVSLAAVTHDPSLSLRPAEELQSAAPSPSPRQGLALPVDETHEAVRASELEDPFVDPPRSVRYSENGVERVDVSESMPDSDWEAAFSDEEQAKLDARANFFDTRVNEVVGGLLAARLDPLEDTLGSIQHALAALSGRPHSARHDRRSASGELQMSDADDEDDEAPVPRRSMSPRRDRRMEQIRAAVLEAMASQQHSQPPAPAADAAPRESLDSVIRAVEEIKEQFGKSLHLDFRGEDLRNIVEEAVLSRLPPTPPQPAVAPGQEDLSARHNELQARFAELEQRLRQEEARAEKEIAQRRDAEDKAAELEKKLQVAETRVEVEIMNRSAYDQRVVDLEDKLKHQEEKAEAEVDVRRAAEDRLSEVQRLLRISSEEETRLREALEESQQQLRAAEDHHGKSALRLSLLETATSNAQKTQSDLQNLANASDQEARRWRSEAERATDLSRRQGADLTQALDENRQLHKLIDTLQVQLKENERVRETWRHKVVGLQDDMARAAREIAEENARRFKKEQAMLARQDVLDAKLQAESKTRERLETELERLESVERQGMRAVTESKRLEAILVELRNDNHKLQQSALRYQAEFQEARESGAREVQRTRESLQAELEEANHQVNVVREELEDQAARLRAQLDQVRLDADTAKARHDMLLEEAVSTRRSELEERDRKHQNELEDLQASYERRLSNTAEDAQRSEQNLLERLSISTSKSEHLQERVAHLEERLQIAQEAAQAAAQAAAKAASPSMAPAPAEPAVVTPSPPAGAAVQARVPRTAELPEKISPQALRESIMVLQEQLQEREQRIEELEQTLSKVDPDAEIKIIKRDDEIIWLRELLAVRHSDLQDIITALAREDYDKDAVKDAAIRLKANLQMEEQERERAMNGGSAISLPNIAATIRDAATPRVAQAVGPLAAAWGNWRKNSNQGGAFGSLSGVLSSPASANSATPRKDSPASQSSFLSGLLTPPASGLRQTPPTAGPGQQPTAFSSTGRRFTAQDLANRPRGPPAAPRRAATAAAADKKAPLPPVGSTPPARRQSRAQPVTPPMMRPSAYDSDAQAEDFDDAGFFDD